MAVMPTSLRNFLDDKLEQGFMKQARDKNEFRLYDETKLTPVNEWIEALLGGQYEQGTSYLCTLDGIVDKDTGEIILLNRSYCCLGVLVDIHTKSWYDDECDLITDAYDDDGNKYFELREFLQSDYDNGEGSMINFSTAEDLGFFPQTQDLLACLNDYGASFSDIAKVIAANDIREVRAIFDRRDVEED